MRKLGFSEKWISLMMLCVSTVSYSILINGVPTGFIKPTRGIRQGDNLSHSCSYYVLKDSMVCSPNWL